MMAIKLMILGRMEMCGSNGGGGNVGMMLMMVIMLARLLTMKQYR